MEKQQCRFYARRRRKAKPRANKPLPSNRYVPGSGTAVISGPKLNASKLVPSAPTSRSVIL